MNEELIQQMALDYANKEGGSPFACIALKRAYEQGMRDAINLVGNSTETNIEDPRITESQAVELGY